MKKVSFLCVKKHIALAVSLILVASLLIFTGGNVCAADAQSQTEEEGYNTGESIVQVVLLYQDTDSVYHVLQSGSGILVDDKTVITNNHLTHMSDTLKTDAAAYLTDKLGYDIVFEKTDDSSQNVASYSVAIVQEADIYNIATVSLSSNDWDFAILTLSSQSGKTPATLGRSEYTTIDQEVSAIGLPTMTYDNPVSFSYKDVMTTTGKCTGIDGGVISFDARLEAGSSGGALVDKYGRVIGITIYNEGDEGGYTALPIDNIKGYLDRSGVVYTEDDRTIEDIEAVDTEEVINEFKTDKNELNRVIMEAQLIYDEGNNEKYTDESFRNLRLNLDYAKITYDDPEATQSIIDSDTTNLRTAIDGLEKLEPKSNVGLIVAISVGGSVVVALIIVLTVILVKNGKKRKKEKQEAEKIKTLAAAQEQPKQEVQATKNWDNQKATPSAQLYSQFRERTLMPGTEQGTSGQEDNAPGTTILTNYSRRSVTGYLYCSSTGETIQIEGEEFTIGKAQGQVNYVIQNNPTISRIHAKIVRKYDEFFLEDLGSTNFSYINCERIAPGDKRVLQDRDVIYLSDEEFVFMLSS